MQRGFAYIPDGDEWHNQSHGVWIEATTSLPLGFTLNGNVTFTYQAARDTSISSYPNPGSLVPNEVWRRSGKPCLLAVSAAKTTLLRPFCLAS